MAMTAPAISERPRLSQVAVVARREMRSALAGRWFWLWTGAFVALAAMLVTVALPDSDVTGYTGFGRTSASLVTLVQVIVPLMGLTLGAASLSGQRETGALRFLLSHPISRSEALLGTFAGLAGSLAVAVAGGFGVAGLLSVAGGVREHTGALLWIAGLAWLLSVAMLGLGMLISTFARPGSASGVAIFAWLLFVFVGDLGLMATSAATRMPVGVLFFSALANPIEAFRLAALTSFTGSLDVLGPAGTFALDTLGASLRPVLAVAMVAWVVVPLGGAWVRFCGRSDV